MKRTKGFIVVMLLVLAGLVYGATEGDPRNSYGNDKGVYAETRTVFVATTPICVITKAQGDIIMDWKLRNDPDSSIDVWYDFDSSVATGTCSRVYTVSESTETRIIQVGYNLRNNANGYTGKVLSVTRGSTAGSDVGAIIWYKPGVVDEYFADDDVIWARKEDSGAYVSTATVSAHAGWGTVNGYFTGEDNLLQPGEWDSSQGRISDEVYAITESATGTKLYVTIFKRYQR